MRKGGYRIIDLNDTNFTLDVAMMISGIHDEIGVVIGNLFYSQV